MAWYPETFSWLTNNMIHVGNFPMTSCQLPRNLLVTRVMGKFWGSRHNGMGLMLQDNHWSEAQPLMVEVQLANTNNRILQKRNTVMLQEKLKGKNKLVPRLLGITKDSVVRVDEKTKEVCHGFFVLCSLCFKQWIIFAVFFSFKLISTVYLCSTEALKVSNALLALQWVLSRMHSFQVTW